MIYMFYVGTSGEMDISRDKWFSLGFNSLEINSTFYRQPKDSTFIKWKDAAPNKFKFTVKVNKFITHMKKLVDFRSTWGDLWSGYQLLDDKLGCLLFQFPPGFKNSKNKGIDGLTHTKRLEETVKYLRELTKIDIAMEFRNISWFKKDIIDILKKYNIALVIDVTSEKRNYFGNLPPDIFPKISTANYTYIRLHGSKGKFRGRYSKEKLTDIIKLLKKFNNKNNYIYFNNSFLTKEDKGCNIKKIKIRSAAICDAYTFDNLI